MSESTKHDVIYLQMCDDEDSEWCDTVTWSKYREHESDVKYIRADLVESLRQQLVSRDAEVAEANHAHEFMSATYRAATKEIDQLREQVTLLRDELNTIYKLVPDLVVLMEPSALAATEPKI